jgi:hypothetical protein
MCPAGNNLEVCPAGKNLVVRSLKIRALVTGLCTSSGRFRRRDESYSALP